MKICTPPPPGTDQQVYHMFNLKPENKRGVAMLEKIMAEKFAVC